MRRALLSLSALFLAPLLLPGVSIRNAYPDFMEAGQFQRLQEFFTGREATGNRLVPRSDPEERTGQYFVVRLDEPLRALPEGSEFVLEIISTDEIAPVTHRFPVTAGAKPRSRHVLLGLTGETWPNPLRQALAWRIQLRSPEDTLSEWKSFLWEMP